MKTKMLEIENKDMERTLSVITILYPLLRAWSASGLLLSLEESQMEQIRIRDQ